MAKSGPSASADLERLRRWSRHKAPNTLLFICGVAYILGSVVVFSIGYSVLNEVSDDLTNNPTYEYISDGAPPPCGLPGTDVMHLLQAFDRHEREFGFPQLIEPSYKEWSKEVTSAVCARNSLWSSDGDDGYYPGVANVGVTAGPTVGNDNGLSKDFQESIENEARELRVIAQLTRNWTMNPSVDETTNLVTAATVAQAYSNLIENVCRDDDESFYSHRLRYAYGDLKTRVVRAYLAAAPSFYKYNKDLVADTDQKGCLGDRNPFLTGGGCQNSDHVRVVLARAGTADASAQLAGVANGEFPTRFSEQVLALLALAMVSHLDRTVNNGACFKNANKDTSHAFCYSIYAGASFPDGGNANPMTGYAATEAALDSHKCSWYAKLPPSPPGTPPFIRDDTTTAAFSTAHGVVDVCSNLLQYGLFDQGRLFGVPDVMRSFVVDARVGASSHVLAPPIYNGLYYDVVNTGDGSGNPFHNPLRRLETYLAYRLASVTIWGMVIGSAVGYFFARAAVPMYFQTLRCIGLRDNKSKVPFFTRPSIETPTFLAAIVAILGGYWTLYTDPAIQSHYPITGDCADWLVGEDHSASGVFVTSWGKRRFIRYGEQQLGIAMFALGVLPLIYSVVAVVIDPRIRFWRDRKENWVGPNNTMFWLIFLCSVISQAMLGWEATQSGLDWRNVAEGSGDTRPEIATLTKDCKAAVMIAFWSGAVAGAARSRWTVDALSMFWKTGWAGITVTLIWVQLAQYWALLPDEWEDAFAVPSGDPGRLGRIWTLFVSNIVQTIMILWTFRTLIISSVSSLGSFARFRRTQRAKDAVSEQLITQEQKRVRLKFLRAARCAGNGASGGGASAAIGNDRCLGEKLVAAPIRPFDFDLSSQRLLPAGDHFSFRFTDAQLSHTDDTGHTTALPPALLFAGRRQKDNVPYFPMLKIQH